MLVLTRRLEEEIRIGDNVTIKVVGIDGQKVRLGITAPPSVGIVRTELCQRRPNGPCVPSASVPS
jgi:carbon storage regulator